MAAALRISPLTPRLGAEIHGFDITSHEAPQFDALYRAWLDYKLLLLPAQAIDLDALQHFSRRFGELMRLPYVKPLDGYPFVIRVLKQANEVGMGVFGGEWHSDFSFLAEPPMASVLLAEDVPAVGGDTLWVDMAKACAALPAALERRLENRFALHAGKPYGVLHAPDEATRFRGSIEIERGNPEADRPARHPVICRHPDTGERMLFVNPTYTTAIEDLSAADSTALLDAVYHHCLRPEFACRVRWHAGTVALWDNRSTMHYAVNDYDGHRRCLYRTTIRGRAPLPG